MIYITGRRLNLVKVLQELQDNSAGAVSIFMGNVRHQSQSGNVTEIYYEAYEKMAEVIMLEIEKEVQSKWDIKKLVAVHRIGNLKVGETSVIIGVSSEHRQEAFEACKYTINNVKSRVPIWKKEISEGGHQWAKGISLGKIK